MAPFPNIILTLLRRRCRIPLFLGDLAVSAFPLGSGIMLECLAALGYLFFCVYKDIVRPCRV